MPTIHRFSTTPIKGMQLHHPQQITVESWGVVGNRRFLFIDTNKSNYDGGKNAALMPIRAEYEPASNQLTLALPDGRELVGAATPAGDPMALELWGKEGSARAVPGPWDAVATEILGRSVRLVEPKPGWGNDIDPMTFVSLASLQELGAFFDGAPVDGARFRMTMDIDGVSPYEEDTWEGRRLQVGSTVLRVGEKVPRCVITTWNPADGKRDLDTLRAINTTRERTPDGLPFGMYATVEEPGTIAVGDPIKVLS